MPRMTNGTINKKKVNAENYEVPEGEEKQVHLLFVTYKFDKDTGKDKSERRVVKISPKQFNQIGKPMIEHRSLVVVLHSPKNSINDQLLEIIKTKAEAVEARKKEQDEML